jgi:outer membrane protein TolC
MRLLIEMAEKRFYPDFTLGMSIFENRILKQVGTDAPEPAFPTRPMVKEANWFGSNDAFIRETRIKYEALEKEIEELKNSTVYEIDQALYRYENAFRLRTLYEARLVPKTKLTVEINETMYITGKVDFMDLLNSQQLYLNYSLSLKKAVKDMNVEAARLERLVGSAIDVKAGPDKGDEGG